MTTCPNCNHYFSFEEYEAEMCDLCGKKVDLTIKKKSRKRGAFDL